MKSDRRILGLLAATTLAVLFVTLPAGAVTSTWDGSQGNADWYDPDNWTPAGVPCNDGNTYDVIISDPAAVVNLDRSCAVNSLKLLNGATLNVSNGVMGLTTLSVVIPTAPSQFGLEVRGTLTVRGDSTIDASATRVLIAQPGVYQAHAGAGSYESSTLMAQYLEVLEGLMPDPGGSLNLDYLMSLQISGDLLLDGTNAIPPTVGGGPSPSAAASSLGGQTPPILCLGQTSTSTIGGSWTSSGTVDVTVGKSCTSSSPPSPPPSPGPTPAGDDPDELASQNVQVRLAGNFENGSTAPQLFDARSGYLRLDGAGLSVQQFEVGGQVKPSCDQMLNDNFTWGTLEVANNGIVVFKDTVDNDGLGPIPPEIQVVERLLFGFGTEVTINVAGVWYVTLQNLGDPVSVTAGGTLSSFKSLCFPPAPNTPTASGWAQLAVIIVLVTAGTLTLRRRAAAS